MPFHCPECLSLGSLEITQAIELPPDSRSDEITLQVVRCQACSFCGLAVYEESRRGRLDAEDFLHTGYRVSEAMVDRIGKLISQCPEPGNPRCQCPVHIELGRAHTNGRWAGLHELAGEETFSMRIM